MIRFSKIMRLTMPEQTQRYRNVFESDDGKWVLDDLARECGLFADQHTAGDPVTTANLLGKRWVVLHILAVMGRSKMQMYERIKAQEEAEARQIEEEALFQ